MFRGPTPSLATSRAIVHWRGGEVVLGPGDNPQQSSNLTISSPHKHAAAADLAAVVSPHLGTGPHLGTTRGSRGHVSRVTCLYGDILPQFVCGVIQSRSLIVMIMSQPILPTYLSGVAAVSTSQFGQNGHGLDKVRTVDRQPLTTELAASRPQLLSLPLRSNVILNNFLWRAPACYRSILYWLLM